MKQILRSICVGTLACFTAACGGKIAETSDEAIETVFDNKDYHTLSKAEDVAAKHLSLDINVDFDTKKISGSATWQLERKNSKAKEIIFDTYDLEIDSVLLDNGEKVNFTLGEKDSFLGAPLQIPLNEQTQSCTIYYKTGANATALQWLEASQTFGKKHPFLYTQSQSIHARSWIPTQDGPGVRFTYDANVKAPAGLMALMSAENPQERSADGRYTFKMDIPIPAYLMALAVGDIDFKPIDNKTGVYAEPSILNKARAEFEDVGKMIAVAENLYGPYRWGRYDMLVLPSGFPIGGMENPKLTFCTPTILAGDKSLVNLIAHELAHSWSGNLVTNENWNDFWLNEGFTVYFERRIMEAMHGADYADMLWEIGYQDLEETIADLGADSEDTHLRLNLKGRNPDEGLTEIPYEKGGHLLRLIEQTVGRANMDTFLKSYFDEYAFKTINTRTFIEYINVHLLDANPEWKAAININEWLYAPGIPESCPRGNNKLLIQVDELTKEFVASGKISHAEATNWSTLEWMHFLRGLQKYPITNKEMAHLDNIYHITQRKNSEVAVLWYQLALKTAYEPAYKPMEDFLLVTGREKFLQPLYKAMVALPEGKTWAKKIYASARPNYHPLTRRWIDNIVLN